MKNLLHSPSMPEIILPSKYYLDHFEEFVSLVGSHHQHLMDEAHHQFLNDYSKLKEDAKCLLIRMINRSGKIFLKDLLVYDEITDYEESWAQLLELGLVRPLLEEDLRPYIEWLKKDDYKEILTKRNVSFKKSASKEEFLQQVLKLNLSVQEIRGAQDVIVLKRIDEIEYLLFLYFGKLEQKLILPTLRDLGIRKTNKKGSLFTKFRNIQESKTSFFYASLKRRFKKEKSPFTYSEIKEWPRPTLYESQEIYENLLVQLAQRQEKDEEALEILKLASHYPATAQRARLYFHLGLTQECQLELQRMMDDPFNDEELLFAEDFLLRKFHKKRLSLFTETLRNSEKLAIDESFYRHPEFGVLSHYLDRGIKGHFSENELWNTLFWTFFQEEIDLSAHSEFDHAPAELREKTFLERHAFTISEKIKTTDKEKLKSQFREDEMILDFIEHSGLEAIFGMLLYMAEDFYNRNSGYPDLYIIDKGEIQFIEIKAEGDSLRPSQIKQMRQLEKLGYRVKVLLVNYQYNENQTYVVVDLETTGSASSWNRVTEIGAVKIQNHRVIETFHTLINPERSIPQEIQTLTGITNEMVAGAPLFSDIAAQFLDFAQGSIFVAHNASFDYGFIQNEFSRMEEKFVMPYICTKSWMRKYYPGLGSYGLKNLCAHFHIDLETHHRALCDAQATSQLLRLINEKRSSI